MVTRYNFVFQHNFYWFFISLSKCHAYCFDVGEGQTPLCCPCIQLVGHYLQCSRCHSLTSCCMHIAKSSARSDQSTPFPSSPNIPLIATRRRVTLSTLPYGTPKSVCLLCEMAPPTLNLIHFHQAVL